MYSKTSVTYENIIDFNKERITNTTHHERCVHSEEEVLIHSDGSCPSV